MDIRTMQYFLAVIREGTISAAAESLHVAQPSLSRQMKDLEEELSVTLFERGNRRITLTEEGQVLRRRAEELVRLMQLTQEEIAQVKHQLTGSIRIGAGESQAFRFFAETAATLLKEHPDVQLHITSGDTQDLMDELDNGLIDFALIFTEFDHERFRSIRLPAVDRFGVLMRRDHPLASKAEIRMADLAEVPLMISRASQSYWESVTETRRLNIIGTYNLTNMLAATCVGLYFNVTPEQIDHALANYCPTNNRSQLTITAHNRLIVDTYNANPTSMNAALCNFRDMEVSPKMVILGDMGELGESSHEEHCKVVKFLSENDIDNVWLVGEEFGKTDCSFRKFHDVEEVKAAITADCPEGYYILIKGSNYMHLFELPEKL